MTHTVDTPTLRGVTLQQSQSAAPKQPVEIAAECAYRPLRFCVPGTA